MAEEKAGQQAGFADGESTEGIERMNNMSEHETPPISLSDQILNTLFSSLENQDGFDNDLIERLRDLAKRDELTKSIKVSNVLKITQGGQDEAH